MCVSVDRCHQLTETLLKWLDIKPVVYPGSCKASNTGQFNWHEFLICLHSLRHTKYFDEFTICFHLVFQNVRSCWLARNVFTKGLPSRFLSSAHFPTQVTCTCSWWFIDVTLAPLARRCKPFWQSRVPPLVWMFYSHPNWERARGGVRDTTVEGGSETIIFDLKVPRHCPLVLPGNLQIELLKGQIYHMCGVCESVCACTHMHLDNLCAIHICCYDMKVPRRCREWLNRPAQW
jgi:hypothetical protein